MYYIGLMSGTSVDAIDVVVVDITEDSLQTLSYRQIDFPPELQQRIRQLDASSSIEIVSELDITLAQCFAAAILEVINSCQISVADVVAIGSHGQTVLHLPESPQPRTLQIGDGNLIAALTGIPVVTDFRRMDIAVGGQGAPLAPAFHAWFFREHNNLVVLNIGGMANLTVLSGDDVTGFDSGPGNALLDDWIRKHKGLDYDKDGDWATSGQLQKALLQRMLADEYFTRPAPKSTGKDEFNLIWLENLLASLPGKAKAEDVQATLLELSAVSISDAITKYGNDAGEVLVCGGGCHNKALMTKIADKLKGTKIGTTLTYGIDPDAVEALAFAWLAQQRIDKKPANLPAVTGARESVLLGTIYQAR